MIKPSSLRQFLFGSLALLSLSGCGKVNSRLSESERENFSFTEWCNEWELNACDTVREDDFSDESWQFGQIALEQFLASPSKVEFTRNNYESEDLKNFLDALGSTSLTELIAELPWEKLIKVENTLELTSSEKQSFKLNEVTLDISKTLSLEVIKTGYYRVKGLRLRQDAKKTYYISRLDLRKPGLMTLSGKTIRIKDIPSKYIIGYEEISSPDIAKLNQALPGVLFSSQFSWRELGGIVLSNDQLDVFAENADLLKEDLPEPEYLEQLQYIFETMRTLRIGGKQKNNRVLYASFEKPLACSAILDNIPLVGSLQFDLSFAEQTGLGSLRKTRRGIEMTAFGLDTTIGNISRIRIEGEKLIIKLGFVNIPIDIGEKPPTTGQPDLVALSCE